MLVDVPYEAALDAVAAEALEALVEAPGDIAGDAELLVLLPAQ